MKAAGYITGDMNMDEHDDIGEAFSYLHGDEEPERLNLIVGPEWWVFIKGGFNFTFPDANGVDRRFRFRTSNPSKLEWNHPDDVIILDRATVSEHGSLDITAFEHDSKLDCAISIIQRSGDSLLLATLGNGTYEVQATEDGWFAVRRVSK
jgi:hypothetical protein